MINNNFLKDISPAQTNLSSRIFDLAVSRVLRRVYLSLNDKDKANMESILLSGSSNEKDKFIEKHIPDFKKLFEKEIKMIEKEIKAELEQKL